MHYEIHICGLCGQQASWTRRDRMTYSWQCSNLEHGHKYLSVAAGQVKKIRVYPVDDLTRDALLCLRDRTLSKGVNVSDAGWLRVNEIDRRLKETSGETEAV